MEGSDGKFNPTGNITIAGTIALAAKIHGIYNGTLDEIDTSAAPWYQGYVDYCVKNSINIGNTTDYTTTASRGYFAGVIANALPADALPTINTVAEIPDVASGEWFASNAMTLYKAGIIGGNDKYGTFAPNSNITRAGISVIVAKLADKSLRSTFTLEKTPEKQAAEKAAAEEAKRNSKYYYEFQTVLDYGKFTGATLINSYTTAGFANSITYEYKKGTYTLDQHSAYLSALEKEGFTAKKFNLKTDNASTWIPEYTKGTVVVSPQDLDSDYAIKIVVTQK
jgi:hypothetical protein